MRRLFFPLLIILLAFGLVLPVHAQWGSPPGAGILSPSNDETLQGVISVIGTTDIEGALSWALSFSYDNDPRETWFLISDGDEVYSDEILAQWDTTILTDGNYQLRLRITLQNDETSDMIITNLRVRNYTIVETSTPTIAPNLGPISTIAPTETSTSPSPTLLPRNPIEISESDIRISLVYGAQTAFVLIALIWLYTSIRNKIR